LISEEEAIKIYLTEKKSDGKNLPFKVLFEPDKLSEENKSILISELNKLDVEILAKLISDINKSKESQKKSNATEYFANVGDGIRIAFLMLITKAFLFTVANIPLDDLNSDNYAEDDWVISSINKLSPINSKMESRIIQGALLALIGLRQFATAKKFLEEITALNLKESAKPLFYTLIYFEEGANSEKLNSFGQEIKESSENLIAFINQIYSKNDKT
jgi:hypothetical protein